MNYMLDARCPECENVAKVNDELTKVTCPHCKFEKTYDEYLEIMKDQKTILHIPNVNAGESTKDKHKEVDTILDSIGIVEKQDPDTGVIFIKRNDGKIIKVADLVNDTQNDRDKIVDYLRKIKHVDDIDIIIALGMAKEVLIGLTVNTLSQLVTEVR